MNKSKLQIMIFFCMVMVFVLSACDAQNTGASDAANTVTESATETNESTSDEVTSIQKSDAETSNKTITIGTFWLGSDADPANGWNGWTLTRTLTGENLATVNENMQIVPQLADTWEMVDDLTWKFHIRQGVKFSNGKDLTAEAVKRSLDRVIEKDERAKANAKMASITADGEYIIFKTSVPYASLLANLTEPLFIIVDTEVDDEIMANAPVTTAPYKITRYDGELELVAEANEYYWDGKPGFDGFTMKLVKDNSTRALAMQSGEIQLTQRLDGASLEILKEDGNFNIKEMPSIRSEYLVFNFNHPLLQDKALRHAMSLAMDRETIALIKRAQANGAIFPESAGYGYDKVNLQSFDLEKSKKILSEAGYSDVDGDGILDKNGEKLSFLLPVVDKSSSLAEIIQAMFKEVGIEVKIQVTENITEIRENDAFDLLLLNYATATTGDSKRFLEQNFSTQGTDNFGHYSNADFDAVIETLISEFDQDARIDLTVKAQNIANEDSAAVFLVSTKSNAVSVKNIKNLPVFPIDYYLLSKDTTIE